MNANTALRTSRIRWLLIGVVGFLIFAFFWSMKNERLNSANPITDLAFSPDGKTLAVAAIPGRVHLISRETGARLSTTTLPGSIVDLAFSSDGECIAATATTYNNYALSVWDVATRRHRRVDFGDLRFTGGVLVSKVASLVAAVQSIDNGSQDIVVCDLRTGAEVARLLDIRNKWHWAFSTDDKYLAWTRPKGGIEVLELNTGLTQSWAPTVASPALTAFKSHGSLVALSTHGKTVVIGDDDSVKAIDLATGRTQFAEKVRDVRSLATSVDGSLLAFSGSKIEVWDLDSTEQLISLSKNNRHHHCLAVTSNGNAVALGSANEVRILDLSTGELRGTFSNKKWSIDWPWFAVAFAACTACWILLRVKETGETIGGWSRQTFLTIRLAGSAKTTLFWLGTVTVASCCFAINMFGASAVTLDGVVTYAIAFGFASATAMFLSVNIGAKRASLALWTVCLLVGVWFVTPSASRIPSDMVQLIGRAGMQRALAAYLPSILTTVILVAVPLGVIGGVSGGTVSFLTRRGNTWLFSVLLGTALLVTTVNRGDSIRFLPELQDAWSEYVSSEAAYGAAEGAFRGAMVGALLGCVIVTRRTRTASKSE